MPNRVVLRTLMSKEAAYCLGWAALQQMVVAASTYFIIEAIQLVTEGALAVAMKYVLAFVASLILVFVPNTISLVYLQKWRLRSFARFVEEFVRANGGLTTWAHGRDKARFESWLTNESTLVYGNATDIIYQAYSILLSSLLNVLVISIAIDRRIMAWYLAAAAVLFVSNLLFQKSIARVSLSAQNTRKDLANVMLSAWENIFTGNKYCLGHWQARFGARLAETSKAAVVYDRTRSVISSVTVSVALLVIGAGNGIFLYENQNEPPLIAALLITLPRQLQIVQNIFAFFNTYLSWIGVASQLNELGRVIEIGQSPKDLSAFVQLEHIVVSSGTDQRKFASIPEVFAHISAHEYGRLTLRGKNGSGKSTLLSLLAEKTGESSFFLPSNFTDLAFADENLLNNSDGNRILAVFRELRDLHDVKYVLLDEWDANLDGANLQLVDAAISELAKSKIVVESRHRG